MKRFFLFLLTGILLAGGIAGCGNTPDPISSAPSAVTTTATTAIATAIATATTTSTTTTKATTTTAATTVHTETMRLTVLAHHLTAKTDNADEGYRYLISLDTGDYAPGTILEVTYDGRVMMSFPAQIVAQSVLDTGETDKALTLVEGKILDGSLQEGYTFQADAGGEPIRFINQVQGLLAGARGTLCLYDYGDQDVTFEGYFYSDE